MRLAPIHNALLRDTVLRNAALLWIAVVLGNMIGCGCHHVAHCETGMCPDTGANQTCGPTSPCPAGEACIVGVCVAGVVCSDTAPCPSGQYCSGGTCAADCSASMPCPDGAECSPDGRCIGGACVAVPPLTGCDSACSASMPCPAGLYCDATGHCTGDCSASVSCPAGEVCSSDGHCISAHDTGVCSGAGAPAGCGASCGVTMLCSAGTYCSNGTCTADCSTTAPCSGGRTCSSDGHCVTGGVDGGMSVVCINPRTGQPDATLINCGGTCVSRLSDPENCGSCGHACASTEVCSSGFCFPACPPGSTECSRSCVHLTGDPENCGSCGHACPMHDANDPMALDQSCQSSMCGCGDPHITGLTECGNSCVDVYSNRRNCGSCGHECTTTCASHHDTCTAQGIQCGQAGDGCGGVLDCGGCTTAGDTCGGGGVPNHCGHGGPACVRATTASCPAGYCGPMSDGCGGMITCPTTCTAPDTCGGGGADHLHRCGHPVCSNQSCVDECSMVGLTNCGDRCVDTSSSSTDCGSCGNVCPGPLGHCSGGSCVCIAPTPTGVDGGFASCPPGGCVFCPGFGCTNQQADPTHCGSCTTTCSSTERCVSGTCTPFGT